jgi:hypothetical protein
MVSSAVVAWLSPFYVHVLRGCDPCSQMQRSGLIGFNELAQPLLVHVWAQNEVGTVRSKDMGLRSLSRCFPSFESVIRINLPSGCEDAKVQKVCLRLFQNAEHTRHHYLSFTHILTFLLVLFISFGLLCFHLPLFSFYLNNFLIFL